MGRPTLVPNPATSLQSEVTWAHLVHKFEDSATAARYAGERIVGDDHWESGLLHQELVDVAQQRATAREDDAALCHVGTEFGRSLLECLLDRADDALEGFLQRLEDLVAVEREAAGHAFGQIAPLDGEFAHLLAGIGRADFDLDALGRGIADQDAVVAAHVIHDGFIEAIAPDARRTGVDDAVEREHGHFSGTAPDVEHHAPPRLLHRETCAHRRGHGLTHDSHVACAGTLGRFADRPALDLGRAEGHAHPNP